MSAPTPRRYTEALANSAIPLVRRIVDDLVHRFAEWQDAVSRFEYATIKSRAGAPDPDAEAHQAEAGRLATEIEECVRELEQLGVVCRAFDTGLVIFPSEADGAHYAWRPGEPAVRPWSGYDDAAASPNGTSSSIPSRAQSEAGNSSRASRSRSEGSRE